MTDRRIQYMDLDKIEGALLNPKNHAEQDLAVSLERWGFTEAPLLDERTGRLVVGHGRIDALRARRDRGEPAPDGVRVTKAGRWQVPAQRGWSSKDDQEAFAYLVAGNQLTTAGGWTDDLGPALDQLAAEGTSLDGLGFSADDLDQLLPSCQPTPPPSVVDEIGEPPPDPITRRGDVWTIGPHRLMCGDCRDPDDVATLLDGRPVNLAVTSPPYADRRKYDESSGFAPIPPDEYVAWFEPVAANVADHLAADGSWFVNIREGANDGERDLYVLDLVIAHRRLWGWRYVDDLCWVDTRNGVPGRWPNRHKDAHEPIYHFTRGPKITFHPERNATATDKAFDYSAANSTAGSGSGLLGAADGGYHEGVALPSNVLAIASEAGQSDHTAPFPVKLPAWLVRYYSNPGDMVLDPFTGSGSTLLAAHQHKRVGYGLELSPGYCDVTLERLQRHTGLIPTRDGEPHDFTPAKAP